MRLTLRFLVPLIVALALFAYAAVPLVDTLTTRWFVRDLDMRSNLIANTVQEPLEEMIKAGSPARVLGYFQRLLSDERLYAVGLCLSADSAPIATGAFPSEIRCSALGPFMTPGEHLLRTAKGVLHVAVRRIDARDADAGGARARARHELHRAAQRRDAPLPLLFLRGAHAERRADHRRDRAALLAWMGARACAPCCAGKASCGRPRAPRPSCGRSRATCRRCCASSSTSSGRPTKRSSAGRRTRCAPCCAARCAATT